MHLHYTNIKAGLGLQTIQFMSTGNIPACLIQAAALILMQKHRPFTDWRAVRGLARLLREEERGNLNGYILAAGLRVFKLFLNFYLHGNSKII